jgi:single-stranded DNA-binding protein
VEQEMSMDNSFDVTGNLTRDPSSRIVGDDNKSVVTLDLAVNEKRDDKEKVTYFRITVWGKLGAAAHQNLSTGSNIRVKGRMENNNREMNGVTAYQFNFVADEISYLSPKKS